MATSRAGVQTATVLFTNVNSTDPALTRRHREVAEDVLRRIGGTEPAIGGTEPGDVRAGVAAAFDDAAVAMMCAVQIQRSFEEWGSSKPAAPVRVALAQDQGAAAAVAGQAKDGEILVTHPVRELTEPRGHLFTKRGELQLNGSDVPLFAVRWWEHD